MNSSINVIQNYFPNFTSKQYQQLQQYAEVLTANNQLINLISRKDVEHVLVRHILHSLSIAKFFTFASQETVVDLGTGGGLPGIPLAIVFPKTQFILVDSIAKKIAAVRQMSDNLLLKNVITRHARVEDINDKADVIVTRAVAPLTTLIHWTSKTLKNNLPENRGIIALKGGDLQSEIQAFNARNINIYNLSDCFEEEFFETKKIVFYHL